MKKINLSHKAKKSLIVSGTAVISIGIITVIALTMTGGTPADTAPESSEVSSEPIISIAPIEEDSSTKTQSTAPVFNPEKGESRTTELTTISKPTSQSPAPKIEGDSSKTSDGKETPPTNKALTDKTHKPTYTKPPVAPGSKPKPATKPSNNKPADKKPSKPTDNTPKAGDTKNGKSYVPGFGWVDGTGAGGEETVVEGDWGSGEQIGIMD